MPQGNRQRRKGRLSLPKLTTLESEDESSSSNMLLDINDEDLRRYLEICPKEIIKQDADMLNLRKSLVQRNFLFGTQFTSSTPARIVPGVFNKSSVISPILYQRRFEEKDTSSSSKSTPETAAHRRSSHPVPTGPDKRREISHGRWDDSLSSSETPDAHKRPPRQRHNGGHKSDVRRNSQKLKCTGKSTPNKKAHKKSSTQRRKTDTIRSSHKLEITGIGKHRSSNAERDESFSELESEAADVYEDCERPGGFYSELASILKISPGPGSHRRPSMSPSKKTSIRAHSSVCETPGKSSSESESTLNGAILMQRHSRIALENSVRGINKSLAKEKSIRAHLQVPPNLEGRKELPLGSELVSRKLENSALGRRRNVSASPVKGRSNRTHSQDDCERQKRPAEVETDDEFREPVSGQKRRSNARTDDDTSSSKRDRTQASELEPIPESNRRKSPRCQSKTTETVKENCVIFSKPRGHSSISASPVKGRLTRTHSQDDCERQKRPAEAETDDELREPVSGQKRRSNARTDDDTSSSKRDRTQASELEPIPESNRRKSPRCQSKTTETVKDNCVICSKPREHSSISASPVKGRSTRTHSQDDCERQKRPAEAETDDEFPEPVSDQKRRSNARTDDDTSSSKRDRTQASELEPIPESNRRKSPRCQSKTTETVKENCVICSKPREHSSISASPVKGRSTRTHSQDDCERQKRPAEAETDDEFPEPVSGQKRRSNARTDDDTSSSKRDRTQASELEPIPESNRRKSPRCQSKTTETVKENCVIFSKPRGHSSISASPVKGRSTRTHSQDDCERQKRPAEAETDDELREPVSGQKRRSNARADDDTSSSKRDRTQASELEPIPESNRRKSPRCQSKTTETVKENCVIFSKPRGHSSISASPVKGRSTRTHSQDDKENCVVFLKPHGYAQRGARNHADKIPDGDSKRKENERLPPSPSVGNEASGKPHNYTWMSNVYDKHFDTSPQFDSHVSDKSDSELSVNPVNAPNVPSVGEVSCFERNDVDTRPSCGKSFTRKANNLNAVIENLVSSFSNGPEQTKRSPLCESVNDAAKAKRRQKTAAKNKAEDIENVEPARKITNKEKDTNKQKRRGTKVQKGGNVMTINDTTSEEPTGCRRSTRERKQRDLALPGVVIYLTHNNGPAVCKPKKKTERNKSNARVQSKKVETTDRGGKRGKRNTVQPSLLGSSGGTNESRDAQALRLVEENDGSESETESQFLSGGDFLKDDAPSSSLPIEEERAHRRRTKHLNLRVNNSLFKIEWFGDGTLALDDLESDTSDTTNMRMMHTIGAPTVATSGYIAIGPSVTKPSQLSKKYHLMFYVIKGTAQVCAQDRYYTGGPNCRFFIPFGYEYSISNLSAKKKLVLFCVRIPP